MDDECDSELLTEDRCRGCLGVGVTFCVADQDTCFTESSAGDDEACAYYNCRRGIAKYIDSSISK